MTDPTKNLDYCRFIALAQVLESYDRGKKICLPLIQIMYSVYDVDNNYDALCKFMDDIGYKNFGKIVDDVDEWLDSPDDDVTIHTIDIDPVDIRSSSVINE